MDKYGIIDDTYRAALAAPVISYRLMIQPLDQWENALGELYADILTSDPASQTIGSGGGIRRSLTVTVADEDGRYSPTKDSHFWYNRKFRLWSGVTAGNDTYWQPNGVYYTKSADEYMSRLTISAADKYAALNGELGTGRCVLPFNTDISGGDIYVADLVRETLGLNTGALPLDPIAPIIDPCFETTKLYADIALSAGQYYGEILTTLAAMYGADCFYDRGGRLNFRKKQVHDRPWWYRHQGYAHIFDGSSITEGVRRNTQLKAVNTVTVASDNTEGEAVSVTVCNTDPESPVCVQNIGRQYPDEPVVYISIGDTTRQSAEEKCRQYGIYLLCQHTAQLCSETFAAAEVPHLDVDSLVLVNGEDRLVTGISTDHGTHISQIATCSVSALPTDMEVTVS